MITYFLNCMGVANTKWYEENKIPFTLIAHPSLLFPDQIFYEKKYLTHYCMGRIDIRGTDDPYMEMGVLLMEEESWLKLQTFLHNFKSEEVLPREELFAIFEKQTGHKIKLFNKE